MKKLLFALAFLLIFSFVSAEKVNCNKQSENVFVGIIPFNSFCEIPLKNYKGKIKVEVAEGQYKGKTNFIIPINAYITLEDSFFGSSLRKEVQLKCSSYFGKTLDLRNNLSDSFPYVQECARADEVFGLGLGEPLITLTIDVSNTRPPFGDFGVEIKTKLADNLVKKYIVERFSSAVKSHDSRNILHEFYFGYETEKVYPDLISDTVIKISLDSANYEKERVSFKLTDTKTGKELCTIITDIYNPENDFFDCSRVADIRISAKEDNPREYYNEELRYYFTLELNPKNPKLVGEKSEVKPGDKTDGKTDDLPPANLTELQQKLNESILFEYNRLMGVN